MIDYLFKRVLAYTIDMFLVSIVVSSITSSSIINIQLDDYNKYYNEYIDLYKARYEQVINEVNTCDDLNTLITNKKITEKEYVDALEIINDSLEKEEITKEAYDLECSLIVDKYNSNKMSEEDYAKQVNYLFYMTEKNSTILYLVNIGACLLYFVVFQGFTYGQTLGKKIMRLKVVSSDDNKVTYKQLLIRTLFLYSILYYIGLIITSFLSQDIFITSSNVLYTGNMILSFVLGFMIVFNNRKGLHDHIAKTKVILLDFKGKEIKLDKKLILTKKNMTSDEEKVEEKNNSNRKSKNK